MSSLTFISLFDTFISLSILTSLTCQRFMRSRKAEVLLQSFPFFMNTTLHTLLLGRGWAFMNDDKAPVYSKLLSLFHYFLYRCFSFSTGPKFRLTTLEIQWKAFGYPLFGFYYHISSHIAICIFISIHFTSRCSSCACYNAGLAESGWSTMKCLRLFIVLAF